MAFCSLTRLRVRSIRHLIPFLRTNEQAVKALTNMPGYLKGAELIDRGFVFWTLTIWENAEAMKAFRNGPAHREPMRRISDWCNEAAYAHWTSDTNDLPLWQDAWKQMEVSGVFTKLRHASARQQNRIIPPPKWTKLSRPIAPITAKPSS